MRYFLALCCLCFYAIETSAAELKPFVFENDFETGTALDVKPFVSNGKYTVNFMGITDETSFAGKKCFKLDITVETGTFHVWLIPCKVPVEGKLQLSCRYSVKSSGKAKLGPGAAFSFPGIPFDGYEFFDWRSSMDGEWAKLQINLVAFAKGQVTRLAWNVNDDDVLGCCKGMVLAITGASAGERIIVYLDDLKITGDVVEMSDDFDKQAKSRWQPVKEKHLETIDRMIGEVKQDRLFMSSCASLPPASTLFKTIVAANLTVCQHALEAARQRGYILQSEMKTCMQLRERDNDLLANIASLSALAAQRMSSSGNPAE